VYVGLAQQWCDLLIPRRSMYQSGGGMIRVIEEAILRNCTKDEVDLILESLCLEIG